MSRSEIGSGADRSFGVGDTDSLTGLGSLNVVSEVFLS